MTNINTFFFERFVSCAEREREKKREKMRGRYKKELRKVAPLLSDALPRKTRFRDGHFVRFEC